MWFAAFVGCQGGPATANEPSQTSTPSPTPPPTTGPPLPPPCIVPEGDFGAADANVLAGTDGFGQLGAAIVSFDGPDGPRWAIGAPGAFDLAGGVSIVDATGTVRGEWEGIGFAYAGVALATGDADGDGAIDLAVGGRTAPDEIGAPGGAWRVLGASDGDRFLADSTLYTGDDENDWAGASVALADLDGDGLAELFAGAPFAADEDEEFGIVYRALLDDPAGRFSDLAAGSPGPEQSDAGTAIGHIGDTDGDGLAELAVGAPYADPARMWRIQTFAPGVPLPEAAATEVRGGGASLLGWAFARPTDIDGDGRRDVVVTDPGNGSALAFTGAAAPTMSLSDATHTWSGNLGELVGTSIDALDVDCDDAPDLLLGSYLAEEGAGAAYLWLGANGAGSFDLVTATFVGNLADDLGGYAVGIQVVDERATFAMGAPGADEGAGDGGAVLFFATN